MRKFLIFIGCLLVLGAVLPGCHHVPHYDGRLTAADSLMRTNPDSALTLLEALNSSPARGEVARSDGGGGVDPAWGEMARSDGGGGATLTTEADRAYNGLLLTQARYKAYVTATSDSDINRALNYYRVHPAEREKLTRAYIYKGAVMEELGHPDSAMLFYKTAEATAAPDDYFNLGYTKMRMGALYRDIYAMDGKHIKKYEEALDCFNLTDDRHYQLVCMINLGSLYCLRSPQKADSLLTAGVALSVQLQDTFNYVTSSQNLIKLYISQEKYHAAHRVVKQVLDMNSPFTNVPFCLYSAVVYAHLQRPDSAQLFLDLLKNVPIENELDRLTYCEAARDIALVLGDSTRYLKISETCKSLSDSILLLSTTQEVMSIEDQIDKRLMLSATKSAKSSRAWICFLIFALILVSIVASIIQIRKKRHEENIKHLMMTLKASESQMLELKQSLANLNSLYINDEKLKGFINSYLDLMRDVLDECYHAPNQKHVKNIKEIIKFQKNNQEKWIKLFGFIDIEHNNIISTTRKKYPHLEDKDLLLIAMMTLDFSYIQMAMILGYNNASTISSTKIRLAKKMGLTGSLNDYVSRFRVI